MAKSLNWCGVWRENAWKCAWIIVFVACSSALAQDRKQALDDLRARIERLNRDLAKSEESRGEVADQLRAAEKSISEVNRNLSTLARDQTAIGRELAEANTRIGLAKADIAREETLRDRLIRYQYQTGNTDAIRIILSGDDVAQVERELAYIGYVGRARTAAINRLREKIAVLAALELDAREQQARLSANAEEQKQARVRLVAEQSSRQQVLERLRVDITKNRREVGRLKQDENRLTKLIEQIAIELARKSEAPRETSRGQARRHNDKSEAGAPVRKPGEDRKSVV